MKNLNNNELGISMKALIIAMLAIVILAGITVGAAMKSNDDTVKRIQPKSTNTVRR